MSLIDLVMIAGAGFIGWWLVSWLFDARKPKSPESPGTTAPTTAGSPGLSVMELGERWHAILGVSPDAGKMEIEAGYRAALARCGEHLDADSISRRQQIEAAYEFIRSARQRAP